MYTLSYTNQFGKDVKLAAERGYDIKLLEKAIESLSRSGQLSAHYLTHKLKGRYSDCLECHIKPDWLLIWRQDEKLKEVTLIRTGTHSDLF